MFDKAVIEGHGSSLDEFYRYIYITIIDENKQRYAENRRKSLWLSRLTEKMKEAENLRRNAGCWKSDGSRTVL
jgi:hypothetical protein